MQRKFSIKVKTIDNKILIFDVRKDMKLLELKQTIEEKLQIPVSQQRIIFQGKVLLNESTFFENKIQEDQTILLVAREEPPSETQFQQEQ